MNKMKLKFIFSLFLISFLLNQNPVACYGLKTFQLKEHSTYYSELDHMNIVLKIKVYHDNEPVRDAAVNFYVDNEWVFNDWTNSEGIAKAPVRLDEFGYHYWKVRINKKDTFIVYRSPEWRFHYEPKPYLDIVTQYGEPYGTGNYTYGETASFGLTNEIIELEPGKRLIFNGWIGYGENNYTGPDYENQVLMVNDIREVAKWKLQYYVEVDSELPRFVEPKSGWYDQGDKIALRVKPPSDTSFLYWRGVGNGSYSGAEPYYTITVNNTIFQEALFERENYELKIENDKGLAWGEGVYPAWENVSFGLADDFVYVSPFERYAFNGWVSSSGYIGPIIDASFEINRDTVETSTWKKQYFVNITGVEGGNCTVFSGWVDENTEIILDAKTQEGYSFIGWKGNGDSSYSGQNYNQTLTINSPVNQTAVWKKKYYVNIDSELQATGRGTYIEGESVILEAQESEGLLVRKVFKQWVGDISSSNNPYTFTIDRDIEVTTVYKKDYTFFLGLLGSVIILVGLFFLRLLRE